MNGWFVDVRGIYVVFYYYFEMHLIPSTDAQCMEYVYTYIWLIWLKCMVNVGKYSSPIEHMGSIAKLMSWDSKPPNLKPTWSSPRCRFHRWLWILWWSCDRSPRRLPRDQAWKLFRRDGFRRSPWAPWNMKKETHLGAGFKDFCSCSSHLQNMA